MNHAEQQLPANSRHANETVLIAGCGRLGQAVALQLQAEGARVFGLRRRPEQLPAGIEPIKADLMDTAQLSKCLPQGTSKNFAGATIRPGVEDAVNPALEASWRQDLHTEADGGAGEVFRGHPQDISLIYYIVTPAQFDDQSYRSAFVDGLSNLRDALINRGQSPRRLVFVSSTGVYGQQQGEWIDETSPTEPGRFSGQRLLEAEQLAADCPWPSAIARLGGIYGPGRDMFINKVKKGEPCRPDGFTNRIHADDAVGMLVHLGRATTPAGIYLGVDDEPTTQCQVMEFIAEQLGLPSPPRDEASSSNTRGVGSKRGDNSKLKASGFRFQYPTFREGYQELIRADL
ncbi:nucleoside-diphosphate-sugar epimerases [Halorhodospira halochloris]|uniref:Nucleoside-diphosphate-sugar epimerases n=1 Tax=Halorhodospira halochloris TaxID=1052 RepID=A0A110B4V8_HALHR|nr:SDR family oxidoreductase [Halorhodospira halochloris]MBK1651570.1 NAD(P)-dependent oxidoreductase [Halorhodospira halochloris]BAU57163.1 nucleoside-diphosphate-sugar epimerases [Halorhodospira halochloris]